MRLRGMLDLHLVLGRGKGRGLVVGGMLVVICGNRQRRLLLLLVVRGILLLELMPAVRLLGKRTGLRRLVIWKLLLVLVLLSMLSRRHW